MKPRIRFAPSPTGFLHIGGARTALFNWLYARHTGGTFVLRIEDTDAARNTQEAVDVILNGLRWLGLNWDEGPLVSDATAACKGDRGPYFQSQRKENYQRRVQALLSHGLAYESEGAIKFKMQREPILIPDLVVGDVLRKLTDREEADPDFVIVRSDGQPVFHFVNVVDDLEMGITHVIRGEDHLSNTAKHIALFKAFGVEPPKYAHIPLILNADGSKMSKRDRGASLTTYMEEGFLPEAVNNYLCLLGWSPKDNTEKLSLTEVVERFDLPQILRHNAKFDFEKLLWLQGEYSRDLPNDRFYEMSVHALAKAGLDTNKFDVAYVKAALDTCKGKIKTFSELPVYGGFYFKGEITYDNEAAKKSFVPENKPRLERLRDAFAKQTAFDAASLEAALKETAKELGVKAGVLVHPVRLACTGNSSGPSLYHLLEVLGKAKAMGRIERALAILRNMIDELLIRLFQRHFSDPVAALRRLEAHLTSVELPFDLKAQLRELTYPPQPSLPDGMPSFIYYFVPNSGRGTDQLAQGERDSSSFINTGDGIGLNLGCPVRLLRALDVLAHLSAEDQKSPKDQLRHSRQHLDEIEELLWLTGWKSPSLLRRGGQFTGCSGDVDWALQASGYPIYLEAKFRRSDWPRLSDGQAYSQKGAGFLLKAAHKFPDPPQVSVLHIVGITTFDNIDEDIMHGIGHELEATPQIHAVVIRSMLQMTHVISMSVEIRDRVLGLLTTPAIYDYPVNHGVIFDRDQRDTRVANCQMQHPPKESKAVCLSLQPQGVVPFPMPEPGLYRLNIPWRGIDGEPNFEIVPKYLMQSRS